MATEQLQDGTEYEKDPIGYNETVCPGDELVFISRNGSRNKFHGRVVTAAHVSPTGGIGIYDDRDNRVVTTSHFVRECFHRIVYKEVDLCELDDIFNAVPE